MIIIRADFLCGVYAASDPMTPGATEWPPAPARLFSALVAGACAIGTDPAPLIALEHAPELRFGRAVAAAGGTVFVPGAFITRSQKTKAITRPNRETHRPQMVGLVEPVFFAWPNAPDAFGEWLRPVLDAVHYLGRSESTVRLSLAESLPGMANCLVPDTDGDELLRVPDAGWLKTLQTHHELRNRAAAANPPTAPYQSYSNPRVTAAPSPWGELFVLRPESGDLRRAAQLGVALRAATMSHAPDVMSPVIHGHDHTPHASWVTLPDVGHQHAKGRVLGLGLLLPTNVADPDRAEAVLALSRVSRIDTNHGTLAVRRPGSHEHTPVGIKWRTWSRSSNTWATVTPVVLERHPKRNQSAASVVADSVERAGYPRPASVETSQSSPLRGVPVSREFESRRPGRWIHAVLHFHCRVRGPVLIGRERHFGLGLCRPTTGGTDG